MRVFSSQKTEQLLKKIQLDNWRQLLNRPLDHSHQDLSDDWKLCALGERIRKEGRDLKDISELTPEARLLGYEFSVAIQERDSKKALEILEKIERLPTIWSD